MTRTYDYRHVVTLEETSLVGNVYFTNYLLWQGHCRERFLVEHAPGVLRALRENLALVTVSCQCEFFEELTAADTVELRMSLDRVGDNRISMTFSYYRVVGAMFPLVAKGNQTIACMRRTLDRMEPVPVPDELQVALRKFSRQRSATANGDHLSAGSIEWAINVP